MHFTNAASKWLHLPSSVLGYTLRLSHKTGRAYAFDTDLLHRGAYEGVVNTKDISPMEFSSRLSLSRVVGPSGICDHNARRFSNQLAEIDSFQKFLDSDRCIPSRDDSVRYGDN